MSVQRIEIGMLRKVLEFNIVDSKVDPMLYKCLLAKGIKTGIQNIEIYTKELSEIVYDILTLDCPKVYKSIIDINFDYNIFKLIHRSPIGALNEINSALRKSIDLSRILKILNVNITEGNRLYVEIDEDFYCVRTGNYTKTIKREINEDILIITDEV